MSNKVIDFTLLRRMRTDLEKKSGPPHNACGSELSMGARMLKLESDVAEMKTDVSVLKMEVAALRREVAVLSLNYATKEDLHKEIGAQTWKLVMLVIGFASLLCAAAYFISTHST